MLGVMVPTFNLSTQEQRQVDLCEFQDSQHYIVTSFLKNINKLTTTTKVHNIVCSSLIPKSQNSK